MDNSGKDAAIGFFTADSSETLGITGGYLILNLSGRPLEFHCSLPVRPSRTHEILYGATLRSHLIGERIAPALLERSRLKPLIICIDSVEAIAMQPSVSAPLVLIETAPEPALADPRLARPIESKGGAVEHVRPVGNDVTQADLVRDVLARIRDPFDLTEPFQRIREALREAQQPMTRAA